MDIVFQAPVRRAPMKALSKIARAIQRGWDFGEFLPLRPFSELAPPSLAHLPGSGYRSFHYRGQHQVRRMLALLQPQLYERHWSDGQLWYMLHWGWLRAQLARQYPAWRSEYEIPARLRNWLVEELRLLGFEVQLPLPPQTDSSALITWRASLYFSN